MLVTALLRASSRKTSRVTNRTSCLHIISNLDINFARLISLAHRASHVNEVVILLTTYSMRNPG
jgi:hypothetical protein